jgi:hypothetical protein
MATRSNMVIVMLLTFELDGQVRDLLYYLLLLKF